MAYLAAGTLVRRGFPLPEPSSRLGRIDGLRGLLAMSVVIHHFFLWMQIQYFAAPWEAPSIALLNQLGAGAVGLFFMTTGFVFYPRVLNGFRDTSWITVLVSRAFRILPLVIVSTVAAAVISFLFLGGSHDIGDYGGQMLLWVATWGEPNLGGLADSGRINAYVLWSLKYEWAFYLFVLPLSAVAMDIARALRFPSWTVPAGLLVATAGFRLVDQVEKHATFLPLFAVGMLAFEASRSPALRRILTARPVGIAATIGLVVGALTTPLPYYASLPLFSFFFVCVACGNRLFTTLGKPNWLVLGECSFGIYLLHGIVLFAIFTAGQPLVPSISADAFLVAMPLASVIIAPLTAACFVGIEKPMIATGKRIARELTQQRGLPPAELEVAP
ncbi:acyltransferase family protein [Sphingomonas ginkgonis]|uniref:acyltransferase family protein n=1 Tax=Sphingomonas ginkgonis TaxID=2315330 RepID=UPI00163B007E|nr:acyltransferase [Sphingomonas ginkgonis]